MRYLIMASLQSNEDNSFEDVLANVLSSYTI